jgi:hypothetical protein
MFSIIPSPILRGTSIQTLWQLLLALKTGPRDLSMSWRISLKHLENEGKLLSKFFDEQLNQGFLVPLLSGRPRLYGDPA